MLIMDIQDKSILKILQIDGRASASYISEKIGLSIPAITERMRKMQDFGIIKDGLHIIFEDLQKGLTEYKNDTAETLNQYLTDFTTALKSAYDNTESIVGALESTAADLVAEINKK